MYKSALRRLGAALLTLALTLTPALSCAHSGRTDGSGGHRDNKNKSGLGSYHYHCGGHPAHLHANGVCPYAKSSSSKSKSSSSQKSKPTSSSSARADSDQAMEALISDAVRQGIVNPVVSAETGQDTVNILLGYAAKTVNVRQEPDSGSEKLGFISKGEKIMVIQDNYVPNWHQVLYQDRIGYVSAKYCSLTSIVTKTIPVSDDR